MINYKADYTYLESGDAKIFTMYLLPDEKGKFPVILMRSPYVDSEETQDEAHLAINALNNNKYILDRGYAVVIQHCRGRGKSTGDGSP